MDLIDAKLSDVKKLIHDCVEFESSRSEGLNSLINDILKDPHLQNSPHIANYRARLEANQPKIKTASKKKKTFKRNVDPLLDEILDRSASIYQNTLEAAATQARETERSKAKVETVTVIPDKQIYKLSLGGTLYYLYGSEVYRHIEGENPVYAGDISEPVVDGHKIEPSIVYLSNLNKFEEVIDGYPESADFLYDDDYFYLHLAPELGLIVGDLDDDGEVSFR